MYQDDAQAESNLDTSHQPWDTDPSLKWENIWANQNFASILLEFAQSVEASLDGNIEEVRIRRAPDGNGFMIKVGYLSRRSSQ